MLLGQTRVRQGGRLKVAVKCNSKLQNLVSWVLLLPRGIQGQHLKVLSLPLTDRDVGDRKE